MSEPIQEYIMNIYRYKCRKCSQIYSEWDKYIEHAKKTRHMGIILQVITSDRLIELR